MSAADAVRARLSRLLVESETELRSLVHALDGFLSFVKTSRDAAG